MSLAIDNANLVNYIDQGTTGFTPAVTYTYNSSTGAVVITDGSTIPAGDTLKKVHLRLSDKFGKEVRGIITATGGGGALTLSASTLNVSKGLILHATVLTTNNIAADGSFHNLLAAGAIAGWDTQKNA
jgi:hypothetical protein